jgi:hypothetical protein
MASTAPDTKTAIETHDRALGNDQSYKSSDGLKGNELGHGSNEVSDEELRTAEGQETIDGLVLEQAIEAIESKKSKWWAYLTTREFWIVLFLGYDSLSLSSPLLNANHPIDKSWLSASRPQILLLPSLPIEEHRSQLFRLSSTMSS